MIQLICLIYFRVYDIKQFFCCCFILFIFFKDWAFMCNENVQILHLHPGSVDSWVFIIQLSSALIQTSHPDERA